MKNLIVLCGIVSLAGCSSTTPIKVEPVGVAASRNNGDIESGLYTKPDTGENLLVISQSLRSKIIELQDQNRKLEEAIHDERLKAKTLAQEQNVLEARSAQKSNRELASQKLKKVHRSTTTVEESNE